MGNLSLHFDRHEFACKGLACCGGVAPVSPRLVNSLELLRDLAQRTFPAENVAFIVSSGFRCLTHNRNVKSHDDSYHVRGMAADVQPRGLTPNQLAALALSIPDFENGGIGHYATFVHLDVRTTGKARW